jgi:hypothetical protein
LLGTKFALIDESGLAWDHIINETTIQEASIGLISSEQ